MHDRHLSQTTLGAHYALGTYGARYFGRGVGGLA